MLSGYLKRCARLGQLGCVESMWVFLRRFLILEDDRSWAGNNTEVGEGRALEEVRIRGGFYELA